MNADFQEAADVVAAELLRFVEACKTCGGTGGVRLNPENFFVMDCSHCGDARKALDAYWAAKPPAGGPP